MRNPKFLDNKQHGKVIDELRDNIQRGSKISVISAYFTIYAYDALKKKLANINSMRFVFMKPTYIKLRNELQREFYIEHHDIAEVPQNISGNEFEIKLRNKLTQSAISKECADWIRDKVEIKALRHENTAQSRLVYIDNGGDNVSINGTVDFTTDGLGITPSTRLDSNTCMYGTEMTQGFQMMFDMLWNDQTQVEDVKKQVLQQMEILYKENPPDFIYFITLYNLFYDQLDELSEDTIVKSRTGFKNTKIWNTLYQFQKDGVMGAIDKIEKYGGCIIADSVGLGKTFTALAIIKYYELRNDRVLVLAPKKLRENWTIYTQNDKRNIFADDRFNYDVLNHTDLSRDHGFSGAINLATINWGNYDLLVIDESHNFRNNTPVKDRVTRYERLMRDIIKAGVKTRVLMLSATPVNNRMNDIKNQIAFITEGKYDALIGEGLPNIENTLKKAQTVFNTWSKLSDGKRTSDRFVEMVNVDYFKLLDLLTIARSRRHIEKYYDLNEIGKFPKRLKPVNIYPDIDTKKEFPDIGTVNRIIRQLTLALYSPLYYVRSDKRIAYEQRYDLPIAEGHSVFRQVDREVQLVALVRVNLLKRMESSIHSFKLTVNTILSRIKEALEMINKQQDQYDASLQIEHLNFDDPELEDLTFGNKVKVLLQDMDLIKWKQNLSYDYQKLQKIADIATMVTPDRDNKLHTLERLIIDKRQHPINTGNGKILIFTAFADTAKYLYNCMAEFLAKHSIYTAMITGSGENHSTLPLTETQKQNIHISDLNTVLTLFSPNSKHKDQIFPEVKNDIDVLIATDCISEGQNLQDCDYLINYDIHWNPVRIIQRFGRIDRIGSTNDVIQLVNFWPTKDLDSYINLAQRVKGRMVLVDVSATGEENIIETESSSEMKDLEYRRKQLERLRNEVVDLEDISEGISITDLTFNDFKIDLMEYLKYHKKELEHAPVGLYALAHIDNNFRDTVKSGVIFVLRQIHGKKQTKEQNGLFPYYLIYITENGIVQLTYIHAKKILDYMKKLCSRTHTVDNALVKSFNEQTCNGSQMQAYSNLLEQAISTIVGKKEEIGIASLFHKGGTTLLDDTDNNTEDFELVTFLILK
ncbi:MAG: SNF2-related protein [Megasphaera sp.]|jgi:SNF2 family DNA or RNA helicase|nr:SNF2-related protein [Megasphaera sp.]